MCVCTVLVRHSPKGPKLPKCSLRGTVKGLCWIALPLAKAQWDPMPLVMLFDDQISDACLAASNRYAAPHVLTAQGVCFNDPMFA